MQFKLPATSWFSAWRQRRALRPARVAREVQRCAALSWNEFVAELERAYAERGYQVSVVDSPAADFCLQRDGSLTLVSCKRWQAPSHGIAALTDLEALRQAQGAQHCTYICLGAFTETARRFAQEQNIHLMTELELVQLLLPTKGR